MNEATGFPAERRFEILAVLMLALTAFIFLALATDGYQGDRARSISDLTLVPNSLGKPGAALAGSLYILLGQASHVVYMMTCIWGLMLFRHRPIDRLPTRLAGFLLLTGAIAGVMHLDFSPASGRILLPGGMLGAFVAERSGATFGLAGSNVILASLAIIGLLLGTEFLFVRLIYSLAAGLILVVRSILEMNRRFADSQAARRELRAQLRVEEFAAEEARMATEAQAAKAAAKAGRNAPLAKAPAAKAPAARVPVAVAAPEPIVPVPAAGDDLSRIRVSPEAKNLPVPVAQELPFDAVPEAKAAPELDPLDKIFAEAAEVVDIPAGDAGPLAIPSLAAPARPAAPKKAMLRRKGAWDEGLPPDYKYPKKYKKPPMDMLANATPLDIGDLTEGLRQTGVLLEETLQTFGIEARVTDVTRGPTITRFEIEPAAGVKVSRFTSLADDIALALKAHRVRVEAPIPGKGKVGVEVPNDVREDVVIRELLESKQFKNSGGALALALGKDIEGDVKAADLAAMPHLLVAGATGAGKTVCIKTILASLLFTKTPDELQLMLIDPKMVELSIFNDIPHLITPVVIDPKKAAAALSWMINEMEERYRLFAHLRVRNIEVYNQSVENGEIEMEGGEDGDVESMAAIRKLPYIVCIIDELADLMMLARAEVEDAIARLAQLARAVGIHLIIATQRPSVDVLTGVIKANFPTRVSFQVSSRVDSRCILDEIGAERLIGRGDMLYMPAGQSKPLRIQGAFVSDDEMNSLIAYLKTQAPPQYRDEIENYGKQQGLLEEFSDESDELLEDAIRIVVETGQASISMVQRRLRVGYTRAARLIDMMELKGIVGPHLGSKAREILVPTPSRNNEEVA